MSKKNIGNKQIDEIAQRLGQHLKSVGDSERATDSANRAAGGKGTRQGRKGAFFLGAASAAALILAAPLLRPAAKSAIKGGIRLGRQAQGFGSSIKEEFEDITSEARAELANEEASPNQHPEHT